MLCLAVAGNTRAHGQEARWTIDPKGSLAWWQISPHLEHLWGTTCPEEPSWVPGWGRSGGPWTKDGSVVAHPSAWDTVHIPLFPRPRVRFVCTEAVQGEFVAPDTMSWKGARGRVVVQAKALVTGQRFRDGFAHNVVLHVNDYPEIRFSFDSIVDVTRGPGDTLMARAVGSLVVRGVGKPITAPITVWHEAGGVRVLTRFHFPAPVLTDEFKMSPYALGLGVRMGVWKEVWMGADLLLRPKAPGS